MLNKKLTAAVLAVSLSAATLLSACAPKKDAALVNINKGEAAIEYGYGYFFANYYKSLYDMTYGSYYGTDYWSQDLANDGSTMEADVKESVMNELESEYLLEQHAGDYSISLSSDDEKTIDDTVDKFFADNDKETVKAMGATKAYVKKMLTGMFYSHKVEAAVKAETEVSLTDEETGQSKISYVCFSTADTTNSDGSTTAMSDEDKEKAKENAQALAKVYAKDYESKAAELGGEIKTYTYTTAADSYSDATIPESVILAAKEVEEGHTSGVIEDEATGYYVVRMDAVHDDEATATKTQELTDSAQTDHYNEVLDGWKDDLKWEVDDKLWDGISMSEVTYTSKSSGDASESGSTDTNGDSSTEASSAAGDSASGTDAASGTTDATNTQ